MNLHTASMLTVGLCPARSDENGVFRGLGRGRSKLLAGEGTGFEGHSENALDRRDHRFGHGADRRS